MTLQTGNTPKVGQHRSSKAGQVITNRLFGVQIICGPIKFMMYISVDNMISGGANLAIEIQRKAIEKLSKELEKMEAKSYDLTSQWQAEKSKMQVSQKIKEI